MTDASVSGPDRPGLLGHRLLIVTGKGGTGKSTVAATIATVAARAGLRVLLCDMDGKGSSTSMFGGTPGPVGFDPVVVAPNVRAMSMDTEAALREYLRLFSPVPFAGAIGPVAGVIDFVADAAPGVREILVIGKVCWEVRRGAHDLVVVDAEASGHIVSQIAAPRVLGNLVTMGMIRDQTGWMLDILEDPDVTSAIVVTTPEELPVTESIETLRRIRTETATTVGAVIVNRMPAPVLDVDDRLVLDAIMRHPTDGTDVMYRTGALGVLSWADARRREAERMCAEIARECAGAAMLRLPELAEATPSMLAPVLADAISIGS